ncbi:ubiquitin carboxyl-terminal hydrolase 24-like [Prunus yedoensis var. nudiflora]|uniref:Ubiquitin carboxyl-terminal hydrolase 24-like n=1 Tax=Prunus yedoensis var. nudiflora TaxID=2094558 RepID=A0A314Z7B0_PRUYE|nr:ubiquitin carboxyl-terminal hydrolase 24-like [Prunus yedoensis var. nudiflora]
MSSIDVFLFSSAPSGPQKTLILGVSGISNLVMCAKRVILRLGAFAEFVSEFDMPSGSSSKNKDAGVLETGRPFSPAMFEGVL